MSDCIKDLTILQIHTPYLLLIISKKYFFNCRLDDDLRHTCSSLTLSILYYQIAT